MRNRQWLTRSLLWTVALPVAFLLLAVNYWGVESSELLSIFGLTLVMVACAIAIPLAGFGLRWLYRRYRGEQFGKQVK